jgi:DNA-binding MarR family transcriptional regulator
VETDVELASVPAVLNSLALLNRASNARGLSRWVARTITALTPAIKQCNQLVCDGLLLALVPDEDWFDFVEYLEALSVTAPATLRDRLIRRVINGAALRSDATYTAAEILGDWRVYVEALKAAQPGQPLEISLAHQTHALLNDPAALHDIAFSHLRDMWEQRLAGEWGRVTPMLQQAVGRIRGQVAAGMPVLDSLRNVIGRGNATWQSVRLGMTRTVLVPSPHNGMATTFLRGDTTLWVCVGSDLFSPDLARSTPVGRAELLHRLQALADDSRLQILTLLHQHEELSAQDIIARTGITQSSASRDLNSLRNAGFVRERRVGGANKFYRLVANHVANTFEALDQVLNGASAEEEPALPDPPAQHPRELSRFLDPHGYVTVWPSKQKDRLTILTYLADQFAVGRAYSEKEVNAVLKPHTGSDVANLRRYLIDVGLIKRESDGSRYWREE